VFLTRPYSLILLAVLYTVLNAPKPLLIDDSAYYYYAKQIAHDPLHPYGFEMFWWHVPEPANHVLAPPGLPYWWSIAYALFGERPFLWKLWLLPYSLIFVFALDALFRRFAHGLERPLLWMTVLSPTFLPSLNLMLDVPALALTLGALALFFRACTRHSYALCLLAGVVGGLAMETKYTAFMVVPVILLYGLLFWRLHLSVIAAATAVFLFFSFELFIRAQHGESHFLYALGGQESSLSARLKLFWPMLTTLGALTPAVSLLGLAALGVRARTVAVLGAFLGLGFILLAYVNAVVTWSFSASSGDPAAKEVETWPLEFVIFGIYGILATGVTLVGSFWLFLRRPRSQGEAKEMDRADVFLRDDTGAETGIVTADDLLQQYGPTNTKAPAYPWWHSPFRRLDLFLALWLLGEVAGFFLLTPFPAVRRLMGVVVVGTLLTGRLASRSCQGPARRGLVWAVSAAGILLGLTFYSVDMVDAFAEKRAAEEAAKYVRDHDPEGRIWYAGHWGFQYYAEQQGMLPLVANDRQLKNQGSVLQSGDWVVIPDFLAGPPNRWGHVIAQQVYIDDPRYTRLVETREVEDSLPLATVMGFYGGQMPLHSHEGPRVRVRIYRVLETYRPGYYRAIGDHEM
jgi:hypothetical protein